MSYAIMLLIFYFYIMKELFDCFIKHDASNIVDVTL